MNNVEEFCDYVLLLKKGIIKLQGRIEDIKDYYSRNRIEVISNKAIDKILEESELKVISKEDNDYIIQYERREDVDNLVYLISKANISIEKLVYVRPTLNEIFIDQLGD